MGGNAPRKVCSRVEADASPSVLRIHSANRSSLLHSPELVLRPMNFFGERALHAIRVVGGDREVHRFATFHPNHGRRIIDRYEARVVSGNSTVIDIVTRDIRFRIAIPDQGHSGRYRVRIIAAIDDDIFSLRYGGCERDQQNGKQVQGTEVFLYHKFKCKNFCGILPRACRSVF